MPNLQLPGSLVSVEWLRENLDHENLVIFDSSWHMPAAQRDGFREWQQAHMPRARFFDFDQRICEPDAKYPHMMPTADIFEREMQVLGLNQNSIVVVYDSLGIFTSARAWWMLRAMGCDNCAVLNGGLPAWIKAGYATTAELETVIPGDFEARPVAHQFVNADDVLSALDQPSISILDARSVERFRGEVDEPRAGLRRGHMPATKNLPFTELFDDGLMKSKSELLSIFSRQIEPGNRSIFTCGSGVTACVIALGAHLAGYHDLAVYDASWCEWGQPGDLPVETG